MILLNSLKTFLKFAVNKQGVLNLIITGYVNLIKILRNNIKITRHSQIPDKY